MVSAGAAAAGVAAAGLGALTGGAGCRLVGPSGQLLAAAPAWRRKSFSFLHSYEATGRYWRGLEKAGLIRPACGVRLNHSPYGDDTRRFNAVARIGGPLHQIIEQRRCHFILDRVVGGCQWHAYDFDQRLIAHYAAMLGGKFMGGQVHETSCNVAHDWERIKNADKTLAGKKPPSDDPAAIVAWKTAWLGMEYGSVEDYAGRVMPTDQASSWKEIEYWTKKQGARFGGHFTHCEGTGSAALMWHAFYKFGASYSLGEMGPGSSTQSQFAVACLRGSAKGAGKPWGIFFAPWCPKSVTCFIPPKDQSWQAGDVGNGTGGPSSALQRRIFFHTYLSGAHTLHEEWGCEGNLLDFDAGTISSYGKVTRDLLDFQEAHPDVGEPFTPVALVQDGSVPPADVPAGPIWWDTPPVWETLKRLIYAPADADKAAEARTKSGGGLGADSVWESTCYSPAALPELFDVVPSDAAAEVWRDYEEVIPVGAAAVPAGAKACPPKEVYDRLAAAVGRLSPFERSTHLPMQINHRKSDGAWIVGLYNPWGSVRGDVMNVGSILDDACAIRDVLRAKFPVKSARVIHAWPSGSGASVKGDEIAVTVGPGGTLIVEIKQGVESWK